MRRVAVGAAGVAGNGVLYAYFRNAWWSGERADGFRINWERGEPFREQDKFGHAYGGYHLARTGRYLLGVAWFSPARAAAWGAAYAFAFQLQIEVWDAMQAKYGFSPLDVAANTAGAAYALAQAQPGAPAVVRALTPTVSYAPTAALRRWGGTPGSELRPTLDYSGQTYWLSLDVDTLLTGRARAFWPGALRISVGHSITDYVDPASGETRWARRKWLLSLDLDPARLPGDHPAWRTVKRQLRYYRLPAPALQLTPSMRGVAWYR